MYKLIVLLLILTSCNQTKRNSTEKPATISDISSAAPSPPISNLSNFYSITGVIKGRDKALVLLVFDQEKKNGYFTSRVECSTSDKIIYFTYTEENNSTDKMLLRIQVNNPIDYQYPNLLEITQDGLKVISMNQFKNGPDDYSYDSPCQMSGGNPNFYELDFLNTLKKGDILEKTDYNSYKILQATNLKELNIGGALSKSETYVQTYNEYHSCNDQKSFDAGYELARDQKGITQDIELDDYLYNISKNISIYDSYCFKKGVRQYLADNQNN